jgi:hypothetical protein
MLPYADSSHVSMVRYEHFVRRTRHVMQHVFSALGEAEHADHGVLDEFAKPANLSWYVPEGGPPQRRKPSDELDDDGNHLKLRNWLLNQPVYNGAKRWLQASNISASCWMSLCTDKALGFGAMMARLRYAADPSDPCAWATSQAIAKARRADTAAASASGNNGGASSKYDGEDDDDDDDDDDASDELFSKEDDKAVATMATLEVTSPTTAWNRLQSAFPNPETPKFAAMSPPFVLDGGGKGLILRTLGLDANSNRNNNKQPIIIIECGIYLGGSLRIWLESSNRVRVVGVDRRNGPEDYDYRFGMPQFAAWSKYTAQCKADWRNTVHSNLHEHTERYALVPAGSPGGLRLVYDQLGSVTPDIVYVDTDKRFSEIHAALALWPAEHVTGYDWNWGRTGTHEFSPTAHVVCDIAAKYGMRVTAERSTFIIQNPLSPLYDGDDAGVDVCVAVNAEPESHVWKNHK